MGYNKSRKNIYNLQESSFTRKPTLFESKSKITSSEEDEHMRSTGCYYAVKELFGGDYMPQINDYISFEKGVDCLHIGGSSGAFLLNMAVEFPNSNFAGVDPVHMAEILIGLPNISFSLGNVLHGLDFPDNSFDYIQLRTYCYIITRDQWQILLKEVYRLLKPGGCVGFLEYESRKTGNENCVKVFNGIIKMLETYNQEPFISQKLEGWVVNAGLEHIITEETQIDCGPDTSRGKRWRWFWSGGCKHLGPYLSPFLGVPIEEWDEYVNNHVKDMEESHGHITLIRALARKPLE